ncbi:MAG: winged helix-turn-helix transcriptional regulator [Armatimonadetes bacterium]|nr:metalloregulator ArsR/SmtB family transcription factor [Armatimonadota bacterium]MBS1702577.1 winged helix-turn-helix transcriptional regulator [Armatimonadota bacterium]MBS1726006.1 winged helix-turn-helix transcriptional regulator [Armatimonadota bacterium]
MNTETVERVASLFGALSNPTRILIVREIIKEPLNVTAVTERLQIGQSSASQHLAVLERVGLIKVTRSGTSRIYEVRGPRVAKMVDTAEEFCIVHGLRGVPDATEMPEDV